jgi:hypothetical protein
MAVLSKAGCASGPCHGNRVGKGGFKLSLRGEDPDADYRTLTTSLAGRRLDFENPDQSLLLLKPTTDVAHEGGHRLSPDSAEHDLLRSWIAARAPRIRRPTQNSRTRSRRNGSVPASMSGRRSA